MNTNDKITRTFSFTKGIAKVYDEITDGLIEKEFKITFSTLNDTNDKILRKAEKALNSRIVGLKNIRRVDEHYSMPVEKFLELATLEKITDENDENVTA